MSVFSLKRSKTHLEKNMFFDESVDVARYDKVKYNQFEKLTNKQLGFFWRPEEITLGQDSKDFKNLSDAEQHIFISNLKRQILLDSVQGRAPSMAFLPICSLPEVENFIQAWAFFETIHSRSYTHIIRNIYPNPSKVFDDMMDIQEIADCAVDISKYYDDLINWNNLYSINQNLSWFKKLFGWKKSNVYNEYEHKKALWLCLNAVNALEGIRFYASFACSWNFLELKKMEGNAKIIKLIARDENVHLAFTQQTIKLLPKEDPDFAKIREETLPECTKIFEDVIDQEKNWFNYLFQYGSMIGLNEPIGCNYMDWLGSKRAAAVGIDIPTDIKNNPLPWTLKYIGGSEVQAAPQEVEKSEYTIGDINMDVDTDTFSGFKL